MSTSTADATAGIASVGARKASSLSGARSYFASDRIRAAQTVLGLIWLLDGALQFQSFMYSKGFIQMLTSMTPGQPGWVASSVNWAAHTASHNLTIYNTLFALVQCAIGLGLLYRPSVRPALALSFAWVLIVWWFGEAFGMMFMNSIMAEPMTGAPGAVLLYALIGAMIWPGRPGGLLGVRGSRITWSSLWLLFAWLWLQAPNSSANATANALKAAPSGMSWLSTVQLWFADRAQGEGLIIALVLAAASAAIALSVGFNWRPKPFLALAAIIGLAFWVLTQGFGGIFEGGATDPNTGPLLMLMAYVLYLLVPYDARLASADVVPRTPTPEIGVA
jgi:hypothetical protein